MGAGQVTPSGASLYGLYVVGIAAAALGNLAIRMGYEAGWFGRGAGIAIGVLAAIPLVWAAFAFWRLLRSDLDEMLQRVVLEGMAFALVLWIPLTAIYLNLRASGAWVPRLDPPELLLGPAILVAIGVALAARRYQ
jgi:hypothetical protein